MSEWFYSTDGEQRGPIAEAALRALVADRQVRLDDLAWTQGQTDWQPIRHLPALRPPDDPRRPPNVHDGPPPPFRRDLDGAGDRAATAALVFGCVCVISWCFPPTGALAALAGLLCGLFGLKSESRKGQAVGGICLSVFGLLLSVTLGACWVLMVYR